MKEKEKQSIDSFAKKFSNLTESEKCLIIGYILHAEETKKMHQEENTPLSI